jgi:PX domain
MSDYQAVIQGTQLVHPPNGKKFTVCFLCAGFLCVHSLPLTFSGYSPVPGTAISFLCMWFGFSYTSVDCACSLSPPHHYHPCRSFTRQEYIIEVTRDGSTWKVGRRYNDFLHLYNKLKSRHSNAPRKFPSKKFTATATFSPKVTDKRHIKLQVFALLCTYAYDCCCW